MHLPHNFLHSCFCCHHWTFSEAHYQCCSKNRDQPRLLLCETIQYLSFIRKSIKCS
jgi:hypothetical protein